MAVNAKDVQALRQATGAGMMDCKKALEESGGDYEAAKKWLREKGLAASAKRAERESNQGVVALSIDCPKAAIVKLKCETDFVASSESFIAEAQALADLVREKGEAAVAERSKQLDDLKIPSRRTSTSARSFDSTPLPATPWTPTSTSRAAAASTSSSSR